MNTFSRIVAAGLMSVSALVVLPTAASADPSLQSERAAHPRIVQAIHHMNEALKDMEAAPDDFGGNKAAAVRDTRAAIHSLKKALYFRLHMDEAAIDKAE